MINNIKMQKILKKFFLLLKKMQFCVVYIYNKIITSQIRIIGGLQGKVSLLQYILNESYVTLT